MIKIVLISLLMLGCSSVYAETLSFDDSLFVGSFGGLQQRKADVHFRFGGNNFGGMIFRRSAQTLYAPQELRIAGSIKQCTRLLKGLYYNNARGLRVRPLDQETLALLQIKDPSYNNLSIQGGWYTSCDNDAHIYGHITHYRGNERYDLIAGVQYNFANNNFYLPEFGSTLHFYNTIMTSGFLFDSYGGIGEIRGYGLILGSICGNGIVEEGEVCDDGENNGKVGYCNMHCNGETEIEKYHEAAPRGCKYTDEAYIDRGSFNDTFGHRGYEYIEVLRKSCLHRGRTTKEGGWEYKPNSSITRAEVMKTIVKILGIHNDDFYIVTEDKVYPHTQLFADVGIRHWFVWYTQYGLDRGLMNNMYTIQSNQKYFVPDQFATRNEAIKRVIILYDSITHDTLDISGNTRFTDVLRSDPYYYYIRKAEVLGIIHGVPQANGTVKFVGERSIRRAEFAKIISIPFHDLLLENSEE